MNELTFPLIGILVVFGLAVPLATLVSKATLSLMRRRSGALTTFGSGVAYALIVAPVIGPVAWFASAGLHQSEPGSALAACLFEHGGADTCRDALLFVGSLAAVVAVAFFIKARALRGRSVKRWQDRRLRRICASHPRLRSLRVSVMDDAAPALFTRGLWRPEIIASRALLERLDDAALVGALLHEAAHVQDRDPLRFVVARVCLSLNPLGRLLSGDYARWRAAREAACDAAAVHFGADPLDLATALVAAARPDSLGGSVGCALLGPCSVAALQLRVNALVTMAEHPTRRVPRPGLVWSDATLVALTVLLPHWLGSAPLDYLHMGIERLLTMPGLQ